MGALRGNVGVSTTGDPERYVKPALETGISLHSGPTEESRKEFFFRGL
jgi:hypothetical protein